MKTSLIIAVVALSTLGAVLMPHVALSDGDVPRNSRFLSADGGPLSDDCCLDPAAPTFILVHGFRDSGESAASLRQASAIQRYLPEANVIVVDWRPVRLAHKPGQAQEEGLLSVVQAAWGFYQEYLDAVASGKVIGREVAEWVRQKGISPHKTVICGHSLGAQIAAFASNECARPEMCGEKVHTIIAADPAGPEFELNPRETRLDQSDAPHVVVVHTSELLGDEHSVGTSDIYVEWPEEGPRNDVVWHSWARELVTEAFQSDDKSTVHPAASEPRPEFLPSWLRSEILSSLPDECNVQVLAIPGDAQREQRWSVTLRQGQTTRVKFKLERRAAGSSQVAHVGRIANPSVNPGRIRNPSYNAVSLGRGYQP